MDQSDPSSPPAASWFASVWIAAIVCAMAGGIAVVGHFYPDSGAFVAGQSFLLLALVAALALLARFPLLDPLQAAVAFFYLWFGMGPVVVLLDGAAFDTRDAAWASEAGGVLSLPFAAAGLVLFAAAGRVTLLATARHGSSAGFFGAGQTRFDAGSLVWFAAIAAACWAVLFALPLIGVPAITALDYLGATRTEIWWAGVLLAVSEIGFLASIVALSSLVSPSLRSSRLLPAAGVIVLAALTALAITSGSKGRLLYPIAILVVAWTSRRQRPPWLFVAASVAVFLLAVEPYVMTARGVALQRGATTPGERVAIFEEVLHEYLLGSGLGSYGGDDRVKVDRLFRGIFPAAGEALKGASAFDGRWHGDTVVRGILATVPRAILRNKPDSDVGNFFSREILPAWQPSMAKEYVNSIALTVPVEFAANYGWIGGLLAFTVLGALWGALSGIFLGPSPSRHPLSPYFVILSMSLEMPLGGFLAVLRNLVFTVLAVGVVWLVRGRRL
ncbi:MAG: hypothetical protein NEA02_18610 [Thermoanaerobaculia bacterium]|nr:hypothetical protein [Thermoanaerobaculia bacterium]